MWSEPELISDEGDGDLQVYNTDLELQLKLTSKNGVLHVDFSEVNVEMKGYSIKLGG